MRFTLMVAAVSGCLTVAIGAFAAHGLRDLLDAQQVSWMKTALDYQAWHSVALLAIGGLSGQKPARLLNLVAGAFIAGMILFSGSLYGLALSGLRAFALLTPVGGALLLAGWALLALYALRLRPH